MRRRVPDPLFAMLARVMASSRCAGADGAATGEPGRRFAGTAGELPVDADGHVWGPMKSILDPSFQYTASFNTDLAKTFARVRRDHRKDAEASTQAAAEALAKVLPIVRKSAVGR